jgi:UDP:flavonoid glycosyltransferase YjiC (YdhE family)
MATQPITGHVAPALSIAKALVGRGNEVRWYAGERFRSRIEDVGAAFEPYQEAYDFDDRDYNAAFPGRRELAGLAQIRFDFRHLFIDSIAAQHRDLAAILARWPADVLAADPSMGAPFSIHELGGPVTETMPRPCSVPWKHTTRPARQRRC